MSLSPIRPSGTSIGWLVRLLPTWRRVFTWLAGFVGLDVVLTLLSPYNRRLDAVMSIANILWKCLALAPYVPLRNLVQRLTASREAVGLLPPTRPDSVSPDWITSALVSSGVIAAGTVCCGVEATLFDAGKMSYNARLVLQWEPQSGTLEAEKRPPSSVVLKMTRTDLDGRMINHILHVYNEALFYKHLASTLSMPTPRCLYSHTDPISKDFMMLLEDITNSKLLGEHSEVRPLVKTWSAPMQHIRRIMRYLAEMHAQVVRCFSFVSFSKLAQGRIKAKNNSSTNLEFSVVKCGVV